MLLVDKNIKLNNISKIVNDNSPSFSGIASQECKGNLWVNSLDAPTIAIAESYAVGGYAILGTYGAPKDISDLKAFLENDLFVQIKKNGSNCFEFSIESESLRDYILDMFKDKSIQSEKELSFRINAVPVNRHDIPKEYQIVKVDSVFWRHLLEGYYDNIDFLKTRLLESWHSFEEFEKKSMAYCALIKNRIVAVMVGTAHFHNIVPIDIETEEAHRRKGLAYAIAVEFIADCLKNNYIPQWDCVESNPNSYSMAIKLGFEQIKENTVYWFDI